MFEFDVELDPYSIHLGIDGYSLGDISIKGDYGYLSSSRDIGSNQSIMIFISLSNLLDGITSLNNSKQYIFKGIDSSFDFCIFRNKKGIIVTDNKRIKIAEASKKEFIQTVWESINKFVTKYRTSLEDGEAVTIDLDNSIKEFKNQFSDIIEPFEKISSPKEINKSQLYKLSQSQTTEELFSLNRLENTEIWNLFSGRFGQDYDLIVEIDIDKTKPLIPQLIADYKAISEQKEIEQAIVELTNLIDSYHSEENLETLFKELPIELSLSYFGYTHQQFLIEVLNTLKGHDREGSHTNERA